jgi:NAD(P)-dependent dehydrogenase (short-subunit alcohol dehydrogenase family)
VSEPALIVQPAVGDDLDAVTHVLTAAFEAIRAAVAAERPVVVLLSDADLLGQGDLGDAAVATGLLGLTRAFALEGARQGWRVNAVSHRGGEGPVDESVGALATIPGLTGQLLRVGTEHVGKVSP